MIIITTLVHPIMLDTFSKKDIEYTYAPNMTYNGLMDIISNATGLIVSTQIKIDKQLIDKANKIKWIGRLGSGMEHIDVKYATSKNTESITKKLIYDRLKVFLKSEKIAEDAVDYIYSDRGTTTKSYIKISDVK